VTVLAFFATVFLIALIGTLPSFLEATVSMKSIVDLKPLRRNSVRVWSHILTSDIGSIDKERRAPINLQTSQVVELAPRLHMLSPNTRSATEKCEKCASSSADLFQQNCDGKEWWCFVIGSFSAKRECSLPSLATLCISLHLSSYICVYEYRLKYSTCTCSRFRSSTGLAEYLYAVCITWYLVVPGGCTALLSAYRYTNCYRLSPHLCTHHRVIGVRLHVPDCEYYIQYMQYTTTSKCVTLFVL
jgi:hypothetical protein